MKKKFIILLCAVAIARGDSEDIEAIETKMVRKMEELKKLHSIKIFGDIVTLEKLDDSDVVNDRSKRTDDPLVARVDDFLATRKIKLTFPSDGSAADLFARALGKKSFDFELRGLTTGASEGRTKLKRMVLPVLLALKLKALIVLPIIITLIGLVGIKGLGVGLAALLLSSAVALKALLTPPPSYPARVSYGVVKPEIYHEHWHRSQEEVNQPYKAWAPELPIDPYPYHDLP
ncbi:uncharacterized protein LOC103580131 [Microplitis demolitor]|uniref:uncharacterized protein LOC103580131 n=1 Tax=Microplitis demolitor TaxID=69319 RepID=UPI0004CCE938|nr:uncharacterized protein LOC103580131 [Microplitis demolitor]